ncbi:MAG: succinylglutamate desuccinylase/aspartoacylase family protein [Azospirillaceae bacterium]
MRDPAIQGPSKSGTQDHKEVETGVQHGSELRSRIHNTVDFTRDGRQAAYLRAPQSRDTAGWGVVEIPIVTVANGAGPTVLFTGGVHGDEYEGQIAVSTLARDLKPEEITGRVIMMPAVNVPAVLADRRLSPIDGKDLNRCFPGNPRGTFSDMLAHFVDSQILPHADVSVDLHTAGHSMESALSTNMHHPADPAVRDRTFRLAEAFGAPFNVVFWGVDEGATLTSSVERRGILSLGTELGGWGRVNVDGVAVAHHGLRGVLAHLGMLRGVDPTPRGTRHMMVPDMGCYCFAPGAGVFEPRHRAGEEVEAGDTAGLLHFVEDIDHPPLALRYARSGVLWMAAGPGRVSRGDTVAVTMVDFDPAVAETLGG